MIKPILTKDERLLSESLADTIAKLSRAEVKMKKMASVINFLLEPDPPLQKTGADEIYKIVTSGE